MNPATLTTSTPHPRYLDTAMPTLYSISAGSGAVHVVGDPEMGAYEWEHRDDAGRLLGGSKSVGYGSPGAAMRDGLMRVLGSQLEDAARDVAAHYAPPGDEISLVPYAGPRDATIRAAWAELRNQLEGFQ